MKLEFCIDLSENTPVPIIGLTVDKLSRAARYTMKTIINPVVSQLNREYKHTVPTGIAVRTAIGANANNSFYHHIVFYTKDKSCYSYALENIIYVIHTKYRNNFKTLAADLAHKAASDLNVDEFERLLNCIEYFDLELKNDLQTCFHCESLTGNQKKLLTFGYLRFFEKNTLKKGIPGPIKSIVATYL